MANLQTQNNRFNKNPRKTLILIGLTTIFMLLFIVECFLRLNGEKPASFFVQTAKKLETYNSFFTDKEGVFKADPDYWAKNNKTISDKIQADYSPNNKDITINADGFRGREFKRIQADHPQILFLGDSFTWGCCAEPIQNCFVDLIAKQGYITFNTGIPATGPNQYAYLAEKYIPLLLPDIVAVMLYLGNDINHRPDPMIPGKNMYHATNVGLIKGFDPNGNPLSAQQSYDYYINGYGIKYKIRNILWDMVIGTRLWNFLHLIKQNLRYKQKVISSEYTTKALSRIKKVCDKYKTRFFLFIIPVAPRNATIINGTEDNKHILKDFHPLIPNFLTNEDYMSPPDDHFNNSGHLKYSKFILRAIEKKLFANKLSHR